MRFVLVLVLLTGLAGQLQSQDTLRAVSKKSGKTHILKVPDKMRVDFTGTPTPQRLQVTDVSVEGLNTSAGFVTLNNINSIRASRKKSKALRVLGVVLATGGVLFTTFGIGSAVDGFGGPGFHITLVAGGLGMIVGGVALGTARKTYNPAEWELEVLASLPQ